MGGQRLKKIISSCTIKLFKTMFIIGGKEYSSGDYHFNKVILFVLVIIYHNYSLFFLV